MSANTLSAAQLAQIVQALQAAGVITQTAQPLPQATVAAAPKPAVSFPGNWQGSWDKGTLKLSITPDTLSTHKSKSGRVTWVAGTWDADASTPGNLKTGIAEVGEINGQPVLLEFKLMLGKKR